MADIDLDLEIEIRGLTITWRDIIIVLVLSGGAGRWLLPLVM
jgi:hypothetical protein